MTTFLASTFLHGFNFQLGAVLLSLGFFIYVEDRLRNKLATKFDASIRARRRPEDNFRHSEASFRVMLFNMLFVMLSMVHLMYLGVMFDQSDVQAEGYRWTHTIAKWDSLSFFSHWFMLLSLMLSFLFWNTMQFFQIAFCLRVPWDFFPTSSEELYKYDKYLFFLLSALLVDFQQQYLKMISRFLIFWWCILENTLLDVDNSVKSHIIWGYNWLFVLCIHCHRRDNIFEREGDFLRVFALDAFTAAFQLSEKSGETLGKSQKKASCAQLPPLGSFCASSISKTQAKTVVANKG